MRDTLKTLPRAIRAYGIEALIGWWIDLPRRWLHRWFWKSLFWEPGQGLFRWRTSVREGWSGDHMTPPDPYTVAPPIRRLWMALRFRATWPFEMKDKEWLQ